MQTTTAFAYVLAPYLFIFCIDIHFLGADGLPDIFNVIFSTVVKDVLIFFPEKQNRRKTALSFSDKYKYEPIKTIKALWNEQ